MEANSLPKHLLVAVGSRSDRVCSIGAFARAEARALECVFETVTVLEPDSLDRYPEVARLRQPDVIFFHAPALHDRRRPWNALTSAMKLQKAFPEALFVNIVHEYAEAPQHWRIRQALLARLSDAAVVNTEPDLDGVRPWQARTLRSQLGPTLFIPELIELPEPAAIARAIEKARAEAAPSARADVSEKWVLHPGLLTPGKGINFLGKLVPQLPSHARLIVMGGMGPKKRDRDFATRTLDELKARTQGRLSFVDSPDDPTFRTMLLAADLVVLPYDAGLSERRSSFLSAMSCGANVWTTTGGFTGPLRVETAGAHLVPVEHWESSDSSALKSVADALAEGPSRVLERRARNLVWARGRGWKARAGQLREFVAELLS